MTLRSDPDAVRPERERLRALQRYDLVGAEPSESLRGCVSLAAQICNAPAAMVSLVDETCQRMFGQIGTNVTEVPRDTSFCAHAITQSDLFEVPDTLRDERFSKNPFVTGSPPIRFYAGVPLVTPDGHALGTLCVTDTVPRRLSPQQRVALRSLARQVVDHLELRLLASRLQDQAELLRLATDAIVVRDDIGAVLFWNRGALDLYGWSSEELVGADLDDLLQTDADGAPGERDRALAEHGSWEGELRQTTKHGRKIVVFSRAVVRRDSRGLPRAVLEINTDVTAEKRSAEERKRVVRLLRDQNSRMRELDRVKDDFIASISHEVRTPLACIRGNLDYLLDGDAGVLASEQRECLGVIERNSERVLRLVDDLLSAASEAGRMRLELTRVDLAEIARDSIEAIRPIVRQRDLTVRLQRSGRAVVDGDRGRLTVVVDNLLSNAMKFTPPTGWVTVHVGGDEETVFLRVEDGGIGVPAGEQSQLFDRFYRGSMARDRAIPGSGLGLAICKINVEAHGGTLGMRSAHGRGSTFWLELPLARRPEGAELVAPDMTSGVSVT